MSAIDIKFKLRKRIQNAIWKILGILQTLYTKLEIHIPLMGCNLMLTHFSNTFEYLCDLYIFKKDKTLNE